jgi:coiled-coil domain-containing protein 61
VSVKIFEIVINEQKQLKKKRPHLFEIMASTNDTYYVQFHGVQYVLSILIAPAGSSGKTLLVDIEQEASGARWTGEFASKYIEDITQKTGNYKRFSVFVNMLRKSLDGSGSESVFIDLLTTADLNELKNRRSGKSGNNSVSSQNLNTNGSVRSLLSSSTSSSKNGKRYLILTYTAEFDKVHYPLPLAFEESPSVATLQRTISRLRREKISGSGSSSGNNGSSSVDAVELQRQLHIVRAENESLRRNKGNAAAVEARIAFQKYRETSDMEIAQLKKDCKSLASKLRDARTKQDQVVHKYEKEKNESNKSSTTMKELRSLERKVASLRQQLQREKDSTKRAKSTYERTILKLKNNLKDSKSQLTRWRMQLREANKMNRRSVSRGRSATPRTLGSGRRTATTRGRSTSSTRSGMTSVNTSRSSVNTSTNSRRSIRSARSTRSNRSTRSTRSAQSSGYGQQNRVNRSISANTRRRRATPSPASTYGKFFSYFILF